MAERTAAEQAGEAGPAAVPNGVDAMRHVDVAEVLLEINQRLARIERALSLRGVGEPDERVPTGRV